MSAEEFVSEPCITKDFSTGRSAHPPSTPSSDSHVSAPMVGNIRDARCRIARRYSNAMRTGFGSVLSTKFKNVWK